MARGRGGGSCSADAECAGLVMVRRHFGACEVRGAYVSHDAVRIEIAIKVVALPAPVAPPAE